MLHHRWTWSIHQRLQPLCSNKRHCDGSLPSGPSHRGKSGVLLARVRSDWLFSLEQWLLQASYQTDSQLDVATKCLCWAKVVWKHNVGSKRCQLLSFSRLQQSEVLTSNCAITASTVCSFTTTTHLSLDTDAPVQDVLPVTHLWEDRLPQYKHTGVLCFSSWLELFSEQLGAQSMWHSG